MSFMRDRRDNTGRQNQDSRNSFFGDRGGNSRGGQSGLNGRTSMSRGGGLGGIGSSGTGTGAGGPHFNAKGSISRNGFSSASNFFGKGQTNSFGRDNSTKKKENGLGGVRGATGTDTRDGIFSKASDFFSGKPSLRRGEGRGTPIRGRGGVISGAGFFTGRGNPVGSADESRLGRDNRQSGGGGNSFFGARNQPQSQSQSYSQNSHSIPDKFKELSSYSGHTVKHEIIGNGGRGGSNSIKTQNDKTFAVFTTGIRDLENISDKKLAFLMNGSSSHQNQNLNQSGYRGKTTNNTLRLVGTSNQGSSFLNNGRENKDNQPPSFGRGSENTTKNGGGFFSTSNSDQRGGGGGGGSSFFGGGGSQQNKTAGSSMFQNSSSRGGEGGSLFENGNNNSAHNGGHTTNNNNNSNNGQYSQFMNKNTNRIGGNSGSNGGGLFGNGNQNGQRGDKSGQSGMFSNGGGTSSGNTFNQQKQQGQVQGGTSNSFFQNSQQGQQTNTSSFQLGDPTQNSSNQGGYNPNPPQSQMPLTMQMGDQYQTGAMGPQQINPGLLQLLISQNERIMTQFRGESYSEEENLRADSSLSHIHQSLSKKAKETQVTRVSILDKVDDIESLQRSKWQSDIHQKYFPQYQEGMGASAAYKQDNMEYRVPYHQRNPLWVGKRTRLPQNGSNNLQIPINSKMDKIAIQMKKISRGMQEKESEISKLKRSIRLSRNTEKQFTIKMSICDSSTVSSTLVLLSRSKFETYFLRDAVFEALLSLFSEEDAIKKMQIPYITSTKDESIILSPHDMVKDIYDSITSVMVEFEDEGSEEDVEEDFQMDTAEFLCDPDPNELVDRFGKDSLKSVEDFCVSNEHGMIKFLGTVDISGILNLSDYICISKGSISIFPIEALKHKIGEGLNQPARLFQTGLFNPKKIDLQKFLKKCRKKIGDFGGEFVGFDEARNILEFEIKSHQQQGWRDSKFLITKQLIVILHSLNQIWRLIKLQTRLEIFLEVQKVTHSLSTVFDRQLLELTQQIDAETTNGTGIRPTVLENS